MIEKDIDKKYEMVVVAEPAAILLALSYQAMRELMKIVHEMRPDSDIRVFEYKGTDEGNLQNLASQDPRRKIYVDAKDWDFLNQRAKDKLLSIPSFVRPN